MVEIFSPKRKVDPGLVLITESDFGSILKKILDQSRASVNLMSFAFVTGSEDGLLYYKSAPFKIMQTLKGLKKENARLKLRVFLEGNRDTARKNKITGAHLEKGKVEVRYGPTHVKAFCVDERYLLLGSTNLTDQSLNKNFETNVLIDSSGIAKEFNRYFDYYWKGGEHGGIKLKAPLFADGAFFAKLLKLINSAKRQISFSMYFFKHAAIEKALIAAHGRGVNVSGLVHDHLKFGMDDVKDTRATVARLRAAGIGGLKFSSVKFFTHSKYVIFDEREMLLGTANWLERDVVTHPQLTVHLKDPRICKSLSAHLRMQMAGPDFFR